MKPIIKHELAILTKLRLGPKSVPTLAKEIELHEQTVRKIVSNMKSRNLVQRYGYNKGSLAYRVNNEYNREMPLIYRWHHQLGIWVYSGLHSFLPLIGQETKAIKAARYFPEVASKLLMIGFKYHTLKHDIVTNGGDAAAVTEKAKPLKRELRTLRLAFQDNHKALKDLLDIYDQIESNTDFWSLEHLANHFTAQVDNNGDLIPPVGSHEVVEAFNFYNGQVTN